ncbi:Putative 115 kDa protein in type-1 retrotransposable element R1DM [Eumeta japonica]|uniref:115 kDa protein in type-1 retrotransposable element R1DM n=1 Tax=Eumeta variegata TaxID=151549 RepID=A0A4C2AH72_EUMVA|nr:Putative 115 kDa protein in type-1 retrotransposable element R1DM [Eumeta japonica]
MRGGRRSCLAASEPPWPGPRLPSGPGGSRQVRWRECRRGLQGVVYKAFADDVVLMFSGQSASSIRRNQPLARVHCWGLGWRNILGLTIDKKLTFIPHVAKACKKATNIYKGLARAARATWGLSSEIVRTIYITVIEPIVLYASCAWAPATRKLGVRKMLDAVQRSVALKACRAHRTVSLHSALILARLLPLDIRVRKWPGYMRLSAERFRGHFVDQGARDPCISAICLTAHVPEIGYERRGPRPQTVDRLAVVRPRIFTDGSRIEGKVGAALTEWRDGEETWYSTLRLDPFCTDFQAEMVALQRAIRRVKNGRTGWSTFSVTPGPPWRYWPAKTYHPLAHEARRDISEIVAEGRAVRLFWVRAHAGIAGNEGRAPPSPRRRQRTMTGFRCRTRKEMTSHLAQTLTGHGGFSQYLHRFKLKDSPYCACDPAKIQDVLHVLEECQCFCGALAPKTPIVSRRLSPDKGRFGHLQEGGCKSPYGNHVVRERNGCEKGQEPGLRYARPKNPRRIKAGTIGEFHRRSIADVQGS